MRDFADYSLNELRQALGRKVINIHNGECGTLSFISSEYLDIDNYVRITWEMSKEWIRPYKIGLKTWGVVFESEAVADGYKFDICSFLLYPGLHSMSEEQLKILILKENLSNLSVRDEAVRLLNIIEDNRAWERANTKANRLECKLPGPMPEAQWQKILAEYNAKKVIYR